MEEKEIRNIGTLTVEDRTVEGYGCVFDTPSEYIGWIETIHNGAITNDTINESDVFAKFNHDDGKILARSRNGEGSLLLEVDNKGLHYIFEAPKTALGDEVLEYLHRGDINQSSFAFTVAKGGDKWYKRDGQIYRDIYKIDKLYDVSPVFNPAYSSTSCSARYLEVKQADDQIKQKIKDLMEEMDKL